MATRSRQMSLRFPADLLDRLEAEAQRRSGTSRVSRSDMAVRVTQVFFWLVDHRPDVLRIAEADLDADAGAVAPQGAHFGADELAAISERLAGLTGEVSRLAERYERLSLAERHISTPPEEDGDDAP